MRPKNPGQLGPDLLPRSTGRSLPIALLRAREAVMNEFRPMLARHGVTEQQWRVIRVLGEGGPLDASVLAERASILPPSLTRIIKTLEGKRLITRMRVEADQRRLKLALTAQGRKLIEKVAPEGHAIFGALEKRFGAANMEKLLDMLERLTEHG